MLYLEKLRAIQEKNNSWLCVGLDPQPERLPLEAMRWDEPVLPFNKAIIDATADLVCAYKPNLAFYMQWGASGVIALERTIAYIPNHIPIILDCKISDSSHAQNAWGKGAFDEWNVDAVTVNPCAGLDAVLPLIEKRPTKAIYLLAHPSNPNGLSADVIRASQRWGEEQGGGGAEEQGSRGETAAAVSHAPAHHSPLTTRHSMGHCGYVVGATYPEELAAARELAPQANFLIPGIGAQGGELGAAVRFGPDAVAGPVINAGRSVIYASPGLDFAEAARAAAMALRDEINRLRI